MTLPEYRALVQSLASRRDGTPTYNASVEHASVVIQYLFANAERTVDILSGSLNARVYGRNSVVEEAELFLASSANNKLRIILEKDIPEDRRIHPLFKACSDVSSIELRIASQDVQDRYQFHFVVVDKNSYRFEEDKTKSSAVAAFGHPEGAKNLAKIYEELWADCKSVDVVPADMH